MKKLLLVFVPAVLLLTSCLNTDDHTADPDEVIFYDNFILIHNHGESIAAMLDKFIETYEKNGDMIGVTVSYEDGGAATLTADLDLIGSTNESYKAYGGKLVARLGGFTASASSRITAKYIDVSGIKYSKTYSYGGGISIVDGDSDSQTISFRNFSMSQISSSETIWSLDYSYLNRYDADANIYTWSEGFGVGTFVNYGEFEVAIIEDIVRKGDLKFISSGCYRFKAQYIGNEAPFTARYGGSGGSGIITVTCTDGSFHEYKQNVY